MGVAARRVWVVDAPRARQVTELGREGVDATLVTPTPRRDEDPGLVEESSHSSCSSSTPSQHYDRMRQGRRSRLGHCRQHEERRQHAYR